MRISDWSSDVCSSDLAAVLDRLGQGQYFTDQTMAALIQKRIGAGNGIGLEPAPSAVKRGEGEDAEDAELQRHAERDDPRDDAGRNRRSEENTSELQSLMRISYAVFC